MNLWLSQIICNFAFTILYLLKRVIFCIPLHVRLNDSYSPMLVMESDSTWVCQTKNPNLVKGLWKRIRSWFVEAPWLVLDNPISFLFFIYILYLIVKFIKFISLFCILYKWKRSNHTYSVWRKNKYSMYGFISHNIIQFFTYIYVTHMQWIVLFLLWISTSMKVFGVVHMP